MAKPRAAKVSAKVIKNKMRRSEPIIKDQSAQMGPKSLFSSILHLETCFTQFLALSI